MSFRDRLHALLAADQKFQANEWALADDILAMPEMQAVKAALAVCLESFDWFKYDWAPENLPESVIEWVLS
jgi:hypothetical protein